MNICLLFNKEVFFELPLYEVKIPYIIRSNVEEAGAGFLNSKKGRDTFSHVLDASKCANYQ